MGQGFVQRSCGRIDALRGLGPRTLGALLSMLGSIPAVHNQRSCFVLESLTAGLCFLFHMPLPVTGLSSVSAASSACVVFPDGVMRPHTIFGGLLLTWFHAAGEQPYQRARKG